MTKNNPYVGANDLGLVQDSIEKKPRHECKKRAQIEFMAGQTTQVLFETIYPDVVLTAGTQLKTSRADNKQPQKLEETKSVAIEHMRSLLGTESQEAVEQARWPDALNLLAKKPKKPQGYEKRTSYTFETNNADASSDSLDGLSGGADTTKNNDPARYAFFNELHPGSLAKILKNPGNYGVSIDYKSLAAVLAVSHLMDENDLHGGNIGFYLRPNNNGKPILTFFKIDHDKEMYNAMAPSEKAGIRVTDFTASGEQNPMTSESLQDFPRQSGAYYWPAKSSRTARQSWSREDADAIAALADHGHFKKARDDVFLALAEVDMRECLPRRDDVTRIQDFTEVDTLHAQFERAVFERHAKFQASLVKNLASRAAQAEVERNKAKDALTLLEADTNTNEEHKNFHRRTYQETKNITQNRCERATQSLARAQDAQEKARQQQVTAPANEKLEAALLRLAKDSRKSLANAKIEILALFKAQIKKAKTPKELTAIFQLLQTEAAKFVFQLHSNLWIVRRIRGSHGLTSTALTIYSHLNAKTQELLDSSKSNDETDISELSKQVKGKMATPIRFFTSFEKEEKPENPEIKPAPDMLGAPM